MSNQTNQSSDLNSIHPKRPFPVRLLIYAFAFWSLLGWLRFFRTIMERELVLEVLSGGLFVYLIVAGLFWGVTALPVIWGLMRRRRRTKPLTWVVAVLFPHSIGLSAGALAGSGRSGKLAVHVLLTLFWFGLAGWALQSKPVENISQPLIKETHNGLSEKEVKFICAIWRQWLPDWKRQVRTWFDRGYWSETSVWIHRMGLCLPNTVCSGCGRMTGSG